MHVTNKALALMISVAVLLSFAGNLFITNKLGRLAKTPDITGLPTEGNVTLTVLQLININVTQATIDFGVGFVGDGNTSALLDTEGNSTGWNQSVSDASIEVTNIGQILTNVTVQTNKNGTAFLCENEQLGVDCGVNVTPSIEWWSNNTDPGPGFGETGSCTTVYGARNATIRFNQSSQNYLACSHLNSSDQQDAFVLELRLIVPSDANGTKSATLTFTGSASGPRP